MKTNASDTSINAYHSIVKGEKERTQNAAVLQAISIFGQATGRMISRHTGIENSDVARCLNQLWNPKEGNPVIVISKKDKCVVTGVRVKYYKLISINLQMDLFE